MPVAAPQAKKRALVTVSGEDKRLVQERRGFEREGGCAWSCVLWFSGSLFGHCAPRRQDSPYVFPREVILTLAAFYTVHVAVTRESADEVVLTAFKRVSLRAHPDKGGRLEHCQLLNSAKDAWDRARREPRRAGRPGQPRGPQPRDQAGQREPPQGGQPGQGLGPSRAKGAGRGGRNKEAQRTAEPTLALQGGGGGDRDRRHRGRDGVGSGH